MKRVISLIICVGLTVALFCSCTETETFKATGFSGYVKLCDYKNIKVDKNSEEYKNYFNTLHLSNIAQSGLYDQVDSGKIEFGDVANIDYLGTINDVPFEGGSATGSDLVIGSGQFIDGFEDGLIGVEVGETVDLDLTFPENYQSQDLAGKDCVFKVKVNYRKIPRTPEKSYADLGYKSLKEYTDSIDKECIENFVIKQFLEKSKIKDEPDVDNFKATVILTYFDAKLKTSYGYGIEDYVKKNDTTLNGFAEDYIGRLAENAFDTDPEMKEVRDAILCYYALYDKENLSYDKKELGKTKSYERCFRESELIKEIGIKKLVSYAKVIG